MPDFVYLNELIPDAILDIRYATHYNFIGRPIAGYFASRPSLAREAALALEQAANDLRELGYRLIIYDAYRPQKAVDDFYAWCQSPDNPGHPDFFDHITKKELFERGFLSARSAHTRGSAVDMSLVHPDGSPVDMGGKFDFFSPTSAPDYEGLTEAQKRNRALLAAPMFARGFRRSTGEWWHFRLVNEPYPNTFFDFDVR